ncbi:MAG: hypothetical protein ACOCQD_02350 [archaeon]
MKNVDFCCNFATEHFKGNLVRGKGMSSIKRVIFNPPATIIIYDDDTKTVVKCREDDKYDPKIGFALALLKGCVKSNGTIDRLIEYDPEEFKEEKRKEWKPEIGDFYWLAHKHEIDTHEEQWCNDYTDNVWYGDGRVFKTEEEALEHSRKLFEEECEEEPEKSEENNELRFTTYWEEPYYADVIKKGFNPHSIEILRDNDDLYATKEEAIEKAIERYGVNV